jgi:hypothetical protein
MGTEIGEGRELCLPGPLRWEFSDEGLDHAPASRYLYVLL